MLTWQTVRKVRRPLFNHVLQLLQSATQAELLLCAPGPTSAQQRMFSSGPLRMGRCLGPPAPSRPSASGVLLGLSSRVLVEGPCGLWACPEPLPGLSALAGVRVKQEDPAWSKDKTAGDQRCEPGPARLKALSVRFPAAPAVPVIVRQQRWCLCCLLLELFTPTLLLSCRRPATARRRLSQLWSAKYKTQINRDKR